MTCEELLAQLDAEGDVVTAEAQAHAAACPACARALERWRLAHATLRAIGEEGPPPFLAERVMARLRAERPAAVVRPAYRWLLRPGAVAAALLLAGLSGYTLWSVLRTVEAPVQQARGEAASEAKVAERDLAAASTQEPVPAAPPVAPLRDGTKDERVPAGPTGAPPADNQAKQVLQTRLDEREAVAVAAAGDAGKAPAAPPAEQPTAQPRAVGSVAAPEALRQAEGLAAEETRGEKAQARSSQPALAAFKTAADESAAAVVAVVVRSPDGAQVTVLRLREVAAPPVGSHWSVRVDADGRIRVNDADGGLLGAPGSEAAAALGAARLAPGEYTLIRQGT